MRSLNFMKIINIWKADVLTNYIIIINYSIYRVHFLLIYVAFVKVIMHKLNMSLDKKENMLMMDLSKAYDCIPNELLIPELHAYGSSRVSLKLIYS